MIPAGIFDGGYFFKVTVEGITRSKKVADIAYKIATWLVLAAIAILMLKYLFNLI